MAALPRSVPREVLIENRSILLVRLGAGIVAVEGICPHLGGLLADGRLEADQLTCPVHDAVFDARTGAVLADPFGVVPPGGGVDALRTYPTRVVDGLVEIDLSAAPRP